MQFVLDCPDSFRLRPTMRLMVMGSRDPTSVIGTNEFSQALQTPDGPALLKARHSGDRIVGTVEGDGAAWLLPRMSDYFGLTDQVLGFEPTGKLRSLAARLHGTRLPRSPIVFERLCQVILQQLVSWDDAAGAWQRIVRRYGRKFPGSNLYLPPDATTATKLAYYDLVGCGALPRQARLMLRLNRERGRLQQWLDADPVRLLRYLSSVPGIGVWTLSFFRGFALGDPDVLIRGDYAIPDYVTWFFRRQPRGTDAEMEELLEPWRGHRLRVVHLILQSGITPPRFGPRSASGRFRR